MAGEGEVLTAVQALTGRLTGRRGSARDGGRPSGGRVRPLPTVPSRRPRAARAAWGRLGSDRAPAGAVAHSRAHRPPGGRCGAFAAPPQPPHGPTTSTSLKPFQFMTSGRGPGAVGGDARRTPPSSSAGRVARCASCRPRKSSRPSSAAAGRAASSKSTIQILSHVLLRAEDGWCGLAATDMELSLRVPGVGDRRAAGRRGAAAPGRRHRPEHGRRPGDARAPRRRGRGQRLGRRVVLLAQLPPGRRLPGAARRRGQRA